MLGPQELGSRLPHPSRAGAGGKVFLVHGERPQGRGGVVSENGIRDMGDGKKNKGGLFTNNWIW